MLRFFSWTRKTLTILVCAGAGLLCQSALAANPEPVVAEVAFVDPITITELNALQYGLLDQNLANLETVVITPGGGITDAASRILGGTQAPSELTVTATAGFAITILIDTIVSGTGYSLGTFICNYNTGTDTACDGAGYSETSVASTSLFVGATLTGDGLAVPGTANGSFNATVSYQ